MHRPGRAGPDARGRAAGAGGVPGRRRRRERRGHGLIRAERLTPPGRGGVALLALRGPRAAELLAARFGRALPAPGRVALGVLRDADGEPLDEVLLARAGEDAFELGCHGGAGVVERLLRSFRAAGTREADPDGAGALAYEPDRLRAEAERALPHAATELGCRVLLAQLAGSLGEAVAAARAALPRDPAGARAQVAALLETAPFGRALLAPPRVALTGLPNAGKSSLLNALLGRERVLVSERAGTTRDAIEVEAELDGVPAVLVDTAGLRGGETETETETEAGPDRTDNARRGGVYPLPAPASPDRPSQEKSETATETDGETETETDGETETETDGETETETETEAEAAAEIDPLEAEGMERARASAAGAACRLAVVDGALLAAEARRGGRGGAAARASLTLAGGLAAPRLVALNKADLLDSAGLARARALLGTVGVAPEHVVAVSALRGRGLEELVARLRALLGAPEERAREDGPVVFTARQEGLLQGALRALDAGRLERAATCLAALVGDPAAPGRPRT